MAPPAPAVGPVAGIMFSDVIKSALERQVAGQPQAVNSVVRGVTRAVSSLVPREGPLCAYMFMGPSGTGKTHLVRSLARILHGDERRVLVADSTHFASGDPWLAFVRQLAPLFLVPRVDSPWAVLETPPLSIILVEYLERGRPQVAKALAAALETGRVTLPEGRQGSLGNCLVFLTSSLCTREILEGPGIGFKGAPEEHDSEQDRLLKLCHAAAQEHFGSDLLGRLDALIVFHRLQEGHLAAILDDLVARLNQWLAARAFQCKLLPAAKAFLLERGRRDLQMGARDLVRAHKRFVEFPLGDLMISGRVPAGGFVLVDRKPGADHLHFTIQAAGDGELGVPAGLPRRDVPVAWEAERAR